MAFREYDLNGIQLHVMPTTKFKVTVVSISMHRTLDRATATETALLPYVLMRGSQHFPSSEAIAGALDDLYGASMNGSVSKRGEQQLLDFSLQVANERFISGSENLLRDAFGLMADVVLHPLQQGEQLNRDAVEKEKDLHAKRIDSLLDDKGAYAAERCQQEMCRDERYGIPRLGYKEDLDKIDAATLYRVHRQLLDAAPLHVYVVGHVEPDEVAALVGEVFQVKRGAVSQPEPTLIPRSASDERTVVERMDVNQGKLNIGFRTGIAQADDLYPALVVYNGILGGFTHSKLFTNVREKASLAYYASSSIEALKGLLYIQSGIQVSQFDRALSIIREQVEAMRAGDISDDEMNWTKAALINRYKQSQDQIGSAIELFKSGLVGGRQRDYEDLIQGVEGVTREDVVAVAQGIAYDTVYFLRDLGGEQNA